MQREGWLFLLWKRKKNPMVKTAESGSVLGLNLQGKVLNDSSVGVGVLRVFEEAQNTLSCAGRLRKGRGVSPGKCTSRAHWSAFVGFNVEKRKGG